MAGVFGEHETVKDLDDRELERLARGRLKDSPARGEIPPERPEPKPLEEIAMTPSPSLSTRATTGTIEQRVTSLADALRRARLENAEHPGARRETRGSDAARLELLREHLKPVLAQLPKNCDLFDIAVSHGEPARLFIDAVAFVEMSPDLRRYLFLQDTRRGRVQLGENEQVEPMVETVTAYIARRLVEREKALSGDYSPSHARPDAAPASRAPTIPLPSIDFKEAYGRCLPIYKFVFDHTVKGLAYVLLFTLGVWIFRHLS